MFSSILWSDYVWLHEHTTWSDFKHTPLSELSKAIWVGIALLLIRILVESFVYLPIIYYCGWIDAKQNLSSLIFNHLNFGFLANNTRFRQVSETAWRFIVYTSLCVAGLLILSQQPQFYDLDEYWRGWPNHPVPTAVRWYYVVEAGFYWSLIFGSFTIDVRRSDFWQMVLHHVVAILLLNISWTLNFVRAGSMVLLCHDISDVFLELGKLFVYADRKVAKTVTFVVLLATWIATRLVCFPLYIIWPMITRAPVFIQPDYSWTDLLQRPLMPRIFLGLMCTLLVLHVFWTYLLLKAAVRSLTSEDGVDDARTEKVD